jgi:RND family efflux transporter MFP subunit
MRGGIGTALVFAALLSASAAGQEEGALECSGTVLAYRSSFVNSQVIGTAKEILAEEGEHVEEGAPLCRLDSELEKANYEYTRQQSLDDTALLGAEKAFAQANRDLDRLERSGAGVSEAEREHARYTRDIAEIQVAAEKLKLERLKRLTALRKVELDRNTISAPFSGIVARKFIELGETTYPLDKRLFQLIDISKVYVEVHADIELLRLISTGDAVSVVVDLYPEKTFPGTVTFIAPSADLGGGGFAFKVLVDNPDGLLKPEMKACVRMPVAGAGEGEGGEGTDNSQ